MSRDRVLDPARRAVPRPSARAVRVARTVDEVEQLRATWAGLPVTNIDADLDHFLTVVRRSPDVIGPHVLHVPREQGDLLVVARLVRQRFPVRVGYRTVAWVTARSLLVSFDGILGARDDADLTEALDLLRGQLRSGEADVVVLQKVDADAAVRRVVADTLPGSRVRMEPQVVRRWLATPGSLDELLALRPSKSRQRLRRELSVFRRDFEGRWSIRRLDAPENADRIGPDIEHVAGLTYQRNLDIGSVADDVLTELRMLAARQGWFRGWMLYIDDRPVAFWWGMLYGEVFEPGATGYDPAYQHDGVGSFAMMRMFEDLCLDPAVAVVDFGYGDAEYKQRFANGSTSAGDILLFSRRPRSVAARAAIAVNGTLGRLARHLLERSTRVQALKRQWRAAGRRRGRGA